MAATSCSERRELLDASPELQNLPLEFHLAQVCHVEADHDLGRHAEPSAGGRARDTQIGRDGHVPGAVDEIPEPVIVALLQAGRGPHRDNLRPFPRTAQLLDDDAGRPPA